MLRDWFVTHCLKLYVFTQIKRVEIGEKNENNTYIIQRMDKRPKNEMKYYCVE